MNLSIAVLPNGGKSISKAGEGKANILTIDLVGLCAAALGGTDEPRRIDRMHETTRQAPARHIRLIRRPVARVRDNLAEPDASDGARFRRREDEEMRVGAPQTDSIEFLEWTEGDRLRHSKFVALRDDKNPREVVKEG
jgi:hypothetical protein